MTDYIQGIVEKAVQFQREYTERTLADIITKYDFIVGSIEYEHKLMELLPEGATVICTPYVSPTTIYAIKKFDVLDLLKEPYKAESEVEE